MVRQMKRTGRDPGQLVRLSLLIDDKLEPESVSFWKDQPTIRDRITYEKAVVGLDRDPGAGTMAVTSTG